MVGDLRRLLYIYCTEIDPSLIRNQSKIGQTSIQLWSKSLVQNWSKLDRKLILGRLGGQVPTSDEKMLRESNFLEPLGRQVGGLWVHDGATDGQVGRT